MSVSKRCYLLNTTIFMKNLRQSMTKLTKSSAPSEDSDQQFASAQSDQSLLCTLWVAKDPMLLYADSKDSD